MHFVILIVSVSLISARNQCCFLRFSTVSATLISTFFVSLLKVELNFSLQRNFYTVRGHMTFPAMLKK